MRFSTLGLGRTLFAVSMVFFAAQYLAYGHLAPGLPLGQAWLPPVPPLAYAIGLLLLLCAGAMLATRYSERAALLLGIALVAGVVLVNAAHLATIAAEGTPRTRALEPLALAGIAFILGGWPRAGRYLLAFALCIFGLQHFMYAAGIASLIPPAVPMRLALVYASGLAFIAAGLAIALDVQARLAGLLFAVMMIFFIIVVQIPALAPHPSDGDLWSSLFIPLALCGGGWIVAGAPQRARKQ